VLLRVYDVLGKITATLVDEDKPAGRYAVSFSAQHRQAASGVYFYTLQTDQFTAVRHMLLLK
jgi:hypothetical protein